MPTDVRRQIYSTEQNSQRDRAGIAQRFAIPSVVNGKVYLVAKGGPNSTITTARSDQRSIYKDERMVRFADRSNFKTGRNYCAAQRKW
jgi:hypothetical protein